MAFFSTFYTDLLKGLHNFESNDIRVMLTNGYTPDFANHGAVGDVTNQASGTGYTAGGATIQNAAVALDSGVAEVTADDLTFSALTLTADGAVIYNFTSGRLISYRAFSASKTLIGEDLKIDFSDTDGLIRLGVGTP